MTFLKPLISKDGKVQLTKFEGNELQTVNPQKQDTDSYKICFLDVETTGKNKREDGIVEIAIKCVSVNKYSGKLISVTHSYESFNDPGIPITEEASQVNGITDEMVAGKSIDWEIVGEIFESADLIAAHNASFDRAFLDRALAISEDKLWACTINDIDWLAKGFNSPKQELLCIWHGFYYQSHRAMNDVDALIHLVTHNQYDENKPVMELMQNATIPFYRITAAGSPFDTKDKLKARNYFWDANNRFWWKYLKHDEINPEKQWLIENVYDGPFLGDVNEIPITDKYKL
ncbi:MAG: 3'-5' exonuclease [Candidatus Marinimicrobia bacterium]|jgi:DNA polymerase-3 subunit epsilon|nr:3'-5' exonuclease [Candidatus Neomarinimicrobiota bacterium]